MTKDGTPVGGIGAVSGDPGEGETWADRPLVDDWTANVYQVQPQRALTDVIGHKLVCKAGDVALFDTSIWHTASPNYGARDRENTIISYRGAAVGTSAGDVGEGNSGGRLAIPQEYLEVFDKAGLLSEARKSLLGITSIEKSAQFQSESRGLAHFCVQFQWEN
jgi:hypothetical protein